MTSLAYVLVVVGLCILGAAYQTQTGWLYLMGAAALGLVPLAWAVAWWDLRGARARALPVAPVYQGDSVTLSVAVEREAPGMALGLQLLVPSSLPGRFFGAWRSHLVPAGWHNRALGGLSRTRRALATFDEPAPRRGEFPLPPMLLQSAFPLGLVACTRRAAIDGHYLVYPVGPRLAEVPWLAAASQDAGQRHRFEPGPGAAPRGVREYRPGDPWRQIHWRTTARLGSPHVKETERELGERIVLYLDMRPEVHTPASVEHVVAIATSLYDYVRRQGREVELATQPEATPAAEGDDEPARLAWLARVNPGAGAGAPAGPEGAIVISPAYVPGWQRWASHFVYCPVVAANPMDATAFCPVGVDVAAALEAERG